MVRLHLNSHFKVSLPVSNRQSTNSPVVPIKVFRQFPNESDEEYYNRIYGEA